MCGRTDTTPTIKLRIASSKPGTSIETLATSVQNVGKKHDSNLSARDLSAAMLGSDCKEGGTMYIHNMKSVLGSAISALMRICAIIFMCVPHP
jgi:hypothetical protein